jgi:hypothetical protein
MKRKEWIGTDASLDISLFEYGLLVCKNHSCNLPDEWFCLVGVSTDEEGNYISFDYGYIRDNELMEEDWIDWNSLMSYVGSKLEEWKQLPFVQKLFDLINYYGYENFGFGEYNSFEIKPDELDSYLTNMVGPSQTT